MQIVTKNPHAKFEQNKKKTKMKFSVELLFLISVEVSVSLFPNPSVCVR